MGRLFLNYLPAKQVYICSTCESHLADKGDIISKVRELPGVQVSLFQFGKTQANLIATLCLSRLSNSKVVNVCTGVVEKRLLRTGQHEVADIYCKTCQETLGWKYEVAYEEDQKYKEGKFILEKAKVKHGANWAS